MLISFEKAIPMVCIGVALFIFAGCEKKPEIAGEVLAMVGDRVITKEDFLRRAEYTLRPDFCAGDNYIHRKIVLNSLIAEKLLALETQFSPLDTNIEFQAYILGRREQTMRQWLKKVQGSDQVVIDSIEQRQAYRMAGRTYKLQFVTLPDSLAASGWTKAIQDGYDFETIATTILGSDSIPSRSLTWFDREEDVVWESLFNQGHSKNEILGPLATDSGQYLVLKISAWIDRPAVTDTELRQRWSDVGERLIERKADAKYRQYVANIMAGKQMHLNKPVFFAYAQIANQLYLKTDAEKREMLNKAVWKAEEHIFDEDLTDFPEIDGNEILFEVDGVNWTVDQFEAYLKRHPLVFRKRKMSNKEFPEQLKYAMADLIRDDYLTREAYDLDYDKIPNVVQATQIWVDYYVSRQARNDYLEANLDSSLLVSVGSETQIIEDHLNPLIDSLQTKYSAVIQIDTDMFESLKLSNIPMMVSTRNVPFPLSVPAFPRLTTDNYLDYGQRRIANE
ncbi:hypothetical protein HQ531_05440 [bacterium]|nr:hypothetical protein [bacterium]